MPTNYAFTADDVFLALDLAGNAKGNEATGQITLDRYSVVLTITVRCHDKDMFLDLLARPGMPRPTGRFGREEVESTNVLLRVGGDGSVPMEALDVAVNRLDDIGWDDIKGPVIEVLNRILRESDGSIEQAAPAGTVVQEGKAPAAPATPAPSTITVAAPGAERHLRRVQ